MFDKLRLGKDNFVPCPPSDTSMKRKHENVSFDIKSRDYQTNQLIVNSDKVLCQFIKIISFNKSDSKAEEINGLQVNGGRGAFDRDFTKSSIIRDFDDVLKNPFRYVDLFLLHTLS